MTVDRGSLFGMMQVNLCTGVLPGTLQDAFDY